MPIEIKNVTYVYQPGTPMESRALQDVNLTINEGEFLGIAGTTGSGKSTLIQHLNGLLKPSEGTVLVDGVDINSKKEKKQLQKLRMNVGLVFQYPEYQLFEETVEADVAFGPKKMGLSEQEIKKRVKHTLELLQLDYKKIAKQSPFDLSGGQKRKVAIAGILAMEPKYLVFDEPTAGLDPLGKKEFLELINKLHKKGQSIIMVSHNMDDLAKYCQRMIVMEKGKIIMDDAPNHVFQQHEKLKELGLGVPTMTELMVQLQKKGLPVRTDISDMRETAQEIINVKKESERKDVR